MPISSDQLETAKQLWYPTLVHTSGGIEALQPWAAQVLPQASGRVSGIGTDWYPFQISRADTVKLKGLWLRWQDARSMLRPLATISRKGLGSSLRPRGSVFSNGLRPMIRPSRLIVMNGLEPILRAVFTI